MAHKTNGVRLAFPLVEYEGVTWALVDHDWQPHKPGQELGPDEYLYTLRLVRCGENDIMEEKFVQDVTLEMVEEILASELTFFAQEVS
jgi:hypothetical protein